MGFVEVAGANLVFFVLGYITDDDIDFIDIHDLPFFPGFALYGVFLANLIYEVIIRELSVVPVKWMLVSSSCLVSVRL